MTDDTELDVIEAVLRDGWEIGNLITKIDMEFLASAADAITTLRAERAKGGRVMDDADLTITVTADKPPSGMWHCGPNACWVTVKHHPTQIVARAFHRQQHKAREIAMACVELMVAECGTDTPQFPEATK